MKRRLLTFSYRTDEDAERLQNHLRNCSIRFVAFREYEFVDGGALWEFFVDRGSKAWTEIMSEINFIHAVPYSFVSDRHIDGDGNLVLECVRINV